MLAALFPCGSVTRRAQASGDAGHRRSRGPGRAGAYCGSIGTIGANGDAAFNVAIRTLRLAGGKAMLGLGGGIVADSERPATKWAEALAKGAFLGRSPGPRET